MGESRKRGVTCSKPHQELGTSPRSRSSAQTRPLPQQLPGPLGAGCPEGCGREMHKRTYEWNVCFARGQAGGAGFQKVGASAERTACAERGLRGLRVLARSWLGPGSPAELWRRGPRGPGASPLTQKGRALAAPRRRGSACTGSPHPLTSHVEESPINVIY